MIVIDYINNLICIGCILNINTRYITQLCIDRANELSGVRRPA